MRNGPYHNGIERIMKMNPDTDFKRPVGFPVIP